MAHLKLADYFTLEQKNKQINNLKMKLEEECEKNRNL